MYQIVMSTIHENPEDEKWDSDSFVHGISDPAVAIRAARDYAMAVGRQLGIDFVLTETDPNDDITLFGVWAHLMAPGRGGASVHIEVQRTGDKTDPDEIVRLLVVNAKFANQRQVD